MNKSFEELAKIHSYCWHNKKLLENPWLAGVVRYSRNIGNLDFDREKWQANQDKRNIPIIMCIILQCPKDLIQYCDMKRL